MFTVEDQDKIVLGMIPHMYACMHDYVHVGIPSLGKDIHL